MNNLKLIDLFAGAGGMSLGFKRAGFSIEAAFDNWAPAVRTYRLNLGDHIEQRNINSDLNISTPDVIVGGPPCQGFSSAGLRHAEDERNSLIREYALLIARVKPRAFVFENVEGFLTASGGRFILELLDPLIEAGYHIHLQKINAANYGVPQHRKRVIAVGGLGWSPSFPEPTHAAFGAPGAHRVRANSGLPTPSLLEVISDLPQAIVGGEGILPDHTYIALKADDFERSQLLLPGQSMRHLPESLWHQSYARRAFRRVKDGTPSERRGGAPAGVRRLIGDQPSKAITSGAQREFLHPIEDRPLTIRECATLQTFPKEFLFAGSQKDKMHMIGNAVPPLFAERIALSLLSDFCKNDPFINIDNEGRLLTFVVTHGSGLSPALSEVVELVSGRYELEYHQPSFELEWA
jgi:DNA (cytosine-5)-methyltransferase 1